MKKILFVIARLNVGGTSKYLHQLAINLPKYGYEVLVLTGNVQGDEKEDSVVDEMPIKRIPHLGRKISFKDDFLARKEIKNAIQEFQPDIIYSHTFKAGLLVRSLKIKQPLVHAFHGHSLTDPEFGAFSKKLIIGVERFLASRCTKIVTVGNKVGEDLLKAGIGRPEQFVSIPPGVSAPRRQIKSKVKKLFKIENQNKVIVSWLGRFVSVKAPERVLLIAKQIPNALFIMAGGGQLFNEIKEKLPKNVKLVGWQNSDLIYSISDIVINTSLSEGMPIALIEAQLAGLPVVAIDHGSVSETVLDHSTGLIFSEFGNDYIGGINSLVREKNLRSKYGKQAKIEASKKFLPDVMIQNHIRLFESITTPPSYKPRSS